MKTAELLARQQRLLVRSAELRLRMQGDLQRLQRPAAWLDQVQAGWVWLRQHPEWPLAGLALLLVLKPRRMLAWGGRLWWLWRSARQLRRWRDSLLQRLASH